MQVTIIAERIHVSIHRHVTNVNKQNESKQDKL